MFIHLSSTGLQGAAWGSTIGIIALGAWTSLDMEGLRAGPRSLDVKYFCRVKLSLVQISLLVIHSTKNRHLYGLVHPSNGAGAHGTRLQLVDTDFTWDIVACPSQSLGELDSPMDSRGQLDDFSVPY